MSQLTWGDLLKSQVDNETIEQAIARIIAEHNDDEESHLATGQSLQSHKASDIIDHLAESIITDKLADQAVSIDHMKWDRLVVESRFESLDAINQYVTGSGAIVQYLCSLQMRTLATINSIAKITAESWTEGDGIGFDKNPRFLAVARTSQNINQIIYIVAGDNDLCGFGFKIVNGELFACWLKAGDEYTYSLGTGFNLTIFHRFKANYLSGSKIDFYVDDVLIYTATTNLPLVSDDGGDTVSYWLASITNTIASNRELILRYVCLSQET